MDDFNAGVKWHKIEKRGDKMILVTGGTGFIGKYLVRLLLEQGEPVRILTRNTETLQKSELKCEYVAGDLRDKASLETACKGINEI